MSGPVEAKDLEDSERSGTTNGVASQLMESRVAQVGSMPVKRALPNRGRRTVGAWCFADLFGPANIDGRFSPDIGPHPHLGLQTVTWLTAGELVHHDSLGSEQLIRPGQLNLMTAGHGVAHAEESTDSYRGPIHGVQLWVAQPSSTRDGPPAFEHHPQLPRLDIGNSTATLLVGELDGTASPARRDSDHFGVDLELRSGDTAVPLQPAFEHALLVTDGTAIHQGQPVTPGLLLYLGTGRDELDLRCPEPSRALLLGGVPFGEQLLMWWNFVARTRPEVDTAYEDWTADSGRFGRVRSRLARIEASRPPWWQPTAP
ncbi:MAG TPA: pirin family protein [Acidimicrobiales bacterium]|nr:pirin family protein [Acidimicrobiales bacterium]